MAEKSDHRDVPGVITVAPPASRAARTRGTGRQAERDAAMGDALRSVYQQTVQESVPDEFLDLLGKLD